MKALPSIFLLIMAFFSLHCASNELSPQQSAPASQAETPPEAGLWLSAARWSGSWNRNGIESESDGTWSTQNDLGYRVHLDQGLLVNYSAGFGLCEGSSASVQIPGQGARKAYADPYSQALFSHADSANPSLLETHFIEDLAHPEDIEFGELSFPAARYCWTHWLVARGEEGIAPVEGIDMSGSSIKLWGTFSRNGQSEAFTIDSFWPSSKLDEIDSIVDEAQRIALQQNIAYAIVNIKRPLSHLFDGIDFESASQDQIAGQVLDNLTLLSEWSFTPWVPGNP